MPCYTDPHQGCKHPDNEMENKKCEMIDNINGIIRNYEYYKKESDKVTDILCRLCRILDHVMTPDCCGINPFQLTPHDIQEWWKEHQKWDKFRKK